MIRNLFLVNKWTPCFDYRISFKQIQTSAVVNMAKGKKTQPAKESESKTRKIEAVYSKSVGTVGIRVHAKPGAKDSSITAIGEEAVDIQIGAPPVDGEANTELVKYLSKALDLRKSDVSLDKGSRSREKIVLLETKLTPDEIRQKLAALISS